MKIRQKEPQIQIFIMPNVSFIKPIIDMILIISIDLAKTINRDNRQDYERRLSQICLSRLSAMIYVIGAGNVE